MSRDRRTAGRKVRARPADRRVRSNIVGGNSDLVPSTYMNISLDLGDTGTHSREELLLRAVLRIEDFQRSGAKVLGIFQPDPGGDCLSVLLSWPVDAPRAAADCADEKAMINPHGRSSMGCTH
ncbi:hypothetical protein [Sphingosinicella sp. BN140058]|uniref:hypothetical protein n=1 Tax=Sphingosinicella sp. BN140058 TaxID=1892855 RepID=UPI001012481F|nr:hypothetical protein [Sphingosinicella sp. BN140058]QAY78072.1 hypothetical protein ETR14_17240 [Sphingosinicella sp. BN140058]